MVLSPQTSALVTVLGMSLLSFGCGESEKGDASADEVLSRIEADGDDASLSAPDVVARDGLIRAICPLRAPSASQKTPQATLRPP